MKKVAILYGGLSQGDIFPRCFETHKKNLIDNNKNYEFDIFNHHWIDDGSLHNWCPHYKKLEKVNYDIDEYFIFNTIKPKKYLFESQIDVSSKEYEKYIGEGFKTYGGKNKHPSWNNLMHSNKLNTALNFTVVSMYLSYYKCKELMIQYEDEMKFKYDIIITFRPDYYLFKKIDLKEFNISLLNTFCYYYYNKKLPVKNILNEKNKMGGKINYLSRFYLNLFNISNRNIGIIYLDFFMFIKKYNVSNKIIQKYCDYKIDTNLTDIISYNYCKYLKDNNIKIRRCYKELYGGTVRGKKIVLYYYHIPPKLYHLHYGRKLDYKEILKIEKDSNIKHDESEPNYFDYKEHDYIIPIGTPETINGYNK